MTLGWPIASPWPSAGGTSDASVDEPVIPDGRIFRLARSGQPWRYKGVSAFRLADRFARGEDIAPYCLAYARFNTLRIFPYVPAAEWGAAAWDSPAPAMIVAFIDRVRELGFRVEITLLTDDDPARIQPAIELVRVLIGVRPATVFLEAGNEPKTHKDIAVRALQPILEEAAAAGIPYSSGIYEDERLVFGTYGTDHPDRTADWPRRAHDAYEFFTGDGPHQPHAPLRMPWVLDEIIRPDEAPGDLAQKRRDYRAFGGAAALFGAGATFHCSAAKQAELPAAEDRACADALADGLDAFPADAPLGTYRRIVEPGNEPGGPTQEARTYVVGNYMVRCQQRGTNAPESGWTALDADGVLWRKA